MKMLDISPNPAFFSASRLPRPELIMFDFDGTLVDSQAMIVAAMQEAFTMCGQAPPSSEAIRHIIGLSLPSAVAALLPKDAPAKTIDAVCAGYKAHYSTLRQQAMLYEPLFPDAHNVLKKLSAQGFKLGIATGKSMRGLQACLARHGLEPFFCTLQTADHHPSKPNPAMLNQALAETGVTANATWMIGDTSYDMQMASHAGVTALGVSWGYHAHAHLSQSGAHTVLGEFSHLLDLIALCCEGAKNL
jgi:phosphoglycolate phosphatase